MADDDDLDFNDLFANIFGRNPDEGFQFEVPEELRPYFEEQANRFRLGHYIFKDGKVIPASFLEAATAFEHTDRKIDKTDISNEPNYPGGDMVSTVFLGFDHSSLFSYKAGKTHKPILFETMIFGGKYDQRGFRYASVGEAKQGHWQVVDCIRAGKEPVVSIGEEIWIALFLEMLRDDSNNRGPEAGRDEAGGSDPG